jgi:ankyrin repeat protein
VGFNARDANDITPLIACTMANDASQAKILLELGASPFLRYKGQTPLDIALANPNADPDLISLLKAAMK